VDKNQNRQNLPVVLQSKPFFGQVRKFVALTVPAGFPARRDAGAAEIADSVRERTVLLAAVAGVKLTRQNSLGMVYFDAKSADLGSVSEIIDIATIDCLAGRIQDGKRWACLLRPEVAAKFRLIQEENGELNEL
jgi:hypothetical protein